MTTNYTQECQHIFLRISWLRFALILSITCCGVKFPVTNVVAVETTWTSSNSGDWFDALNWGGPIPNAAGDIAHLVNNPNNNISIAVSSPLSLGKLDISGFSAFSLTGTDALLFDNPGPTPARLSTTSLQKNHIIEVPIGIASDEQLTVGISARNTITLAGGISGNNGHLVKRSSGRLELEGASPDWQGALTIDAGEVSLSHYQALLNTSSVTAKPGSLLTLEPLRDAYVFPQLVLDGATLRTNVGDSRDTTYLKTGIELQSDSTISTSYNRGMYITGDMAGAGGISFLNEPNPVNLEGSSYIYLIGSTFYSGETYIGPNMTVTFRQTADLGDLTSGTHIDRGRLFLSNGGGAEEIFVDSGRLDLGDAETSYGHTVFLNSSQLSGGGDDSPATLSNPVEYVNGALLGTSGSSDDLVIAGGVSGTGSLAIQNEVEIQNGVTARGNLFIRNRSGAQLSGPLQLSGETFIDQGYLWLRGGINAPESRFRVASTFETASGYLFAASDTTIGSVVLDPRYSKRESTFNRSTIAAVDDAILTISQQLRFMGGTISGAIAGQPVLTKQERTEGILENIADSSFERVNVEAGQLIVREDVGTTSIDIHLQDHDTSRVQLENVGIYQGDIYLNNAKGYDGQAALRLAGNTTLEGNIYLGDEGATLSGGYYLDTPVIGANAAIHGGHLTVLSGSPLFIQGGNHTYSGETHILTNSLILTEGGRLNSTSAIIGSGRLSSSGGYAGLVLDNLGSTTHSDRIPDSTPVHLNGMMLSLNGAVNETLGTVHMGQGASEIVVNGSAELRIQILDRQPGGMVNFTKSETTGQFTIVDTPVLDDGLIGGWARFGNEFATYGPNGVVAYSDLHTYKTDLATATSSDNVSLLGPTLPLTADKNINALLVGSTDIDLNGHTLTIESGGLINNLSPMVTVHGEGQLTAGTDDNAELLIGGDMRIDANITDNAFGKVGLTYSGEFGRGNGYMILSGENSYSGPTTLNSGPGGTVVEVISDTALPAGGDLILNGANLRLNYSSETPVEFGHVVIQDGGSLFSLVDDKPQIQPESVVIESGYTSLEIVGNAPITKIGHGWARLENLSSHTGPISIEGGDLYVDSIGPAPIDDAHAITIHNGGRLHPNSNLEITGRKVRLDGGAIDIEHRGAVSAPIEVLSEGGTIRHERGGTTIVSSVITGDGDFNIEGGFGRGSISLEADLKGFNGDLYLSGGTVIVDGDNANYNQPIHVTAAKLIGRGANPFGTGTVSIFPEAELRIYDPLNANLKLAGGVLNFQPYASPLHGNLTVSDHSYAYLVPGSPAPGSTEDPPIPTIQSDIYLTDDSELVITIAPSAAGNNLNSLFKHTLSIQSNITVDGTSTLTSFDSQVDITGTISSASPNAVLNLVGNNTFNIDSSILLAKNTSLTIIQDDISSLVQLVGSGMFLTGNGTLANAVAVADGAVVSPGNSAGEVTVNGDATMGNGAVFEWEIANGAGTAGADWDLWRIQGDLLFEATPLDPWVLGISDLPGVQLTQDEPWLIASATSIQGFDPASVRIDISDIQDALPLLTADQFNVYQDGGDLLLHFVPEPSSLLLVVTFAAIMITRRRA